MVQLLKTADGGYVNINYAMQINGIHVLLANGTHATLAEPFDRNKVVEALDIRQALRLIASA